MKVIFLDFDGVLNSLRTNITYKTFGPIYLKGDKDNIINSHLDPIAVNLVKDLVERHDAKIVISSSWRLFFTINAFIKMFYYCHDWDNAPVIDFTPQVSLKRRRGEEIADWLLDHPEVTEYLILDDDMDMLPSQINHFVHVDSENGLSYNDYMKANQILHGSYERTESYKGLIMDNTFPVVYLSRRNLLTLLAKLNDKRNGGNTACTIIKHDNRHPTYPQSLPAIQVTAIDDKDYYTDRLAGEVFPAHDPSQRQDIDNLMQEIVVVGNKVDNKTVSFCLGKLLEEAGEFAQASMAKSGAISPDKLKHEDQVYEEAADAIILILDTVARVYRKELQNGELSPNDIVQNIFKQVPIKIEKWKEVENIK